MYRYFSNRDFQTAIPSCNIEDMSTDLLEKLDIARYFAGVPFVINSAYRTLGWELDHARDGSSSHTKGFAVDINVKESRYRYLIVKALLKAGFDRIGIHDDFIHVDIDDNKDSEVIWNYCNKNK